MKSNPLPLLYHKINQLSDENPLIREVFDLLYLGDFETEELSAILGKPESEIQGIVARLAEEAGPKAVWQSFIFDYRKLEEKRLQPLPYEKTRLARELEKIKGKDRSQIIRLPFPKTSQSELALAAKTVDVDKLREDFNQNLIPFAETQAHVTVETDTDHLILRFISGENLNGQTIEISQVKATAKPTITRVIKGNQIRFALSELGLTIHELNQIEFNLIDEDL